jgi:hypothetical protein
MEKATTESIRLKKAEKAPPLNSSAIILETGYQREGAAVPVSIRRDAQVPAAAARA